MQFTAEEIKMLTEALDMALASNKRMQTAKPKFHAIFAQMEAELTALKLKLNTPVKQK